MRVLILGAAGFLGSRLAAVLAGTGQMNGRPISELMLCDVRPAAVPSAAACAVSVRQGDLRDAQLMASLFNEPFDAIFHLAAALTLDAEADFRRGLEVNVLALIDLLERCRALPAPPLFLFASSISTFGGQLPATVDETVVQVPTTSYGAHKAIAEQLLRDYARRGFVDARALRLPIVVTHPGPPNGSISDQIAALIREPLQGRVATCRIRPDSRIAVATVDNVVDSFLRLAAVPRSALAAPIINLPALSVTPAQIAAAVGRLAPGSAGLLRWEFDPAVQAIIDGWPQAFSSDLAGPIGIVSDASVHAVVQAYFDGLQHAA